MWGVLINTAQLPLLERGPRYLIRLEHNETGFARRAVGHAGGFVIPGRFDAPHWPDSPSARRGQHGSELKQAVLDARPERLLIDPETWLLPWLTSPEDASLGRAARMAPAQEVPLPLRPGHLRRDRDLRAEFVRAAARSQSDADWPIAPYFLFDSSESEWLDVSLDCIETMRALVGDGVFGAAMYVPLHAVADGTLLVAAERYAAALPRGAPLVLTVCDLRPELDADTLAAYLRSVEALSRRGLEVIVDRPSDFAPATIPFGARAVVLGTRLYRTASASPRWEHDFNPKIATRYLVAGQARRLQVERARRLAAAGRIPRCAVRSCRALDRGSPGDLRIHAAHEMEGALAHAALVGAAALAREWRATRLVRMARWAHAIEEVSRRSEEA